MRRAKNGAILGVGLYVDNELVAENVSFTPPAVSFASSEVNGYGAMTLPAYTLPEAMECSIDFAGLDDGLVASLVGRQIECRWASTSISPDGSQRNVGYKAFCKVFPKTVPSIAISVGEAGSNSVSFDCTRYELFVDGVSSVCIDKEAGVTRLGNVTLSEDLASLL